MKKWMLSVLTLVLVVAGGGAVLASGTFTSSAAYLGQNASGQHQVQIIWDDLGSDVDYYEVAKVPTMFPWGGQVISGCAALTTTVCNDTFAEKGQFDFYVTAYMKDNTVVKAAPAKVIIAGYTGAPATPSITFNHAGGSNYEVGFSIASGNNADQWELYENGTLVNFFQGFLVENGTAAQSATKTRTLSPGTYVYEVKLTNAYGTTTSAPYTVVVP